MKISKTLKNFFDTPEKSPRHSKVSRHTVCRPLLQIIILKLKSLEHFYSFFQLFAHLSFFLNSWALELSALILSFQCVTYHPEISVKAILKTLDLLPDLNKSDKYI